MPYLANVAVGLADLEAAESALASRGLEVGVVLADGGAAVLAD